MRILAASPGRGSRLPLRSLLRISILACCLAWPAHAATLDPVSRGAALYESAVQRLRASTIESRRAAIRELEQATLLDRANPTYELLLARVYFQCGFIRSAQRRFERVARLAPTDADGRFGLGQVWRRDWLKYLEKRSLDLAIDNFSAAAELRPQVADAWLMLVPLFVERGDLTQAVAAATRAAKAEPQRPETILALAHAAFRSGSVHDGDSLFHFAIPRLPRLARERFDDIGPVA